MSGPIGDLCVWCNRSTASGIGGFQRSHFLDCEFVAGSDVGGNLFCSWYCMANYALKRHGNPQGGLYAQDQYMADFRKREAEAGTSPMIPGLQWVETQTED